MEGRSRKEFALVTAPSILREEELDDAGAFITPAAEASGREETSSPSPFSNFLDCLLFCRKPPPSVKDQLAVVGLKKALLVGRQMSDICQMSQIKLKDTID